MALSHPLRLATAYRDDRVCAAQDQQGGNGPRPSPGTSAVGCVRFFSAYPQRSGPGGPTSRVSFFMNRFRKRGKFLAELV
jgi:hypothetical protein